MTKQQIESMLQTLKNQREIIDLLKTCNKELKELNALKDKKIKLLERIDIQLSRQS